MKSLLITLTMLFAINFSYAQWTQNGTTGNYYLNSGNVGIGITTPSTLLHLYSSNNAGTSMLVENNNSGSSTFGGVQFKTNGGSSYIYRTSTTYGSNVANSTVFQDAGGGDFIFYNNSIAMVIKNSGNVGIGTPNPLGTFQVNDFYKKAVLGDASGTGLVNGTSYIGFNAVRMGTTWRCYGDASNDGGGVIYGDTYGNINFVPISSANGTNYAIYTDADIKNKVVFQITPAGVAHAKVIKVDLVNWPDYVFKPTYQLPKLSEVKSYIDQNQHLPDMPTEAEVKKDGINLGEMNKLLVKKVEELTLYLIDLNTEKDKKDKEQQTQIDQLKKQVETLMKRTQ